MARQPTSAPLPGPAQPQAAEPDVHHIAIQQWRRAILGEQRDLPAGRPALVERLDRLAPCSALAVVDLAQIQHVPLHRPAARDPAVLHNAPITALLAVFAAKLVTQKHNASLSKPLAVSQGGWSAPHPGLLRSRRLIGDTPGLTATPREQNFHNPGRVAKVGLVPILSGLTSNVQTQGRIA